MDNIGRPRTYRFEDKLYDEIKSLVKRSDDRYESVSHFIRCAVLKLMREEYGLD